MVLTSFQHYYQPSKRILPVMEGFKDAIDGLDNKLIRILQEDELISCMNGAIVSVITTAWR